LLESLSSKQTKVVICLSVEDAKYCLENLIERGIPFEVTHYAPPMSDVKILEKKLSPITENSENNSIRYNRISVDIIETIKEIRDTFIKDTFDVAPPNEAQLATNYGLTLATFKENFKTIYGKTFYQLYMEKRMEYAAKLLKQGHKCNEVTQMIGYGEKSDIKFNKMFQKHFGITPKKYQMEHLKRGRK
jgi:AraC-like DNA-binding protein